MTINEIIGRAAVPGNISYTEEEIGAAVVKALGEAGYTVAPTEPTVTQFNSAWDEGLRIQKECGGRLDREQFIHMMDRYYRAMLSAAG